MEVTILKWSVLCGGMRQPENAWTLGKIQKIW